MATDIPSEVKRIIKEQLDVDEKDIKPESTFIDDLGADSLGLVELVLPAGGGGETSIIVVLLSLAAPRLVFSAKQLLRPTRPCSESLERSCPPVHRAAGAAQALLAAPELARAHRRPATPELARAHHHRPPKRLAPKNSTANA